MKERTMYCYWKCGIEDFIYMTKQSDRELPLNSIQEELDKTLQFKRSMPRARI